MVLNIGSQLSPVQAILNSSAGTSSYASSPISQFTSQQATLIQGRSSSEVRFQTYQETMNRSIQLERSSWSFLSLQGLDPVMAKREVVADDTSALTGTAANWASARTFGIEIEKIASGQTVISDTLIGADDHTFGNGTKTFYLQFDTDVDDYEMSVDLDDLESNLDVLNATRDAFNDEVDIGAVARVVTDNTTGKSYLEISTYGTGAEVAFTLDDDTGNLLKGLGLETDEGADTAAGTGGVLVSAQDAQYAIDGGASQTSARNGLELFDGAVELTLTGTTDAVIEVHVRPDVSQISSEIQSFLSTWNNQYAFLLDNPGEVTTPMANQLNRSVQSIDNQLSLIGIERDEDGLFSADTTELETAIGDRFDLVTRAFSGTTGLALTARSISRDFLEQASSYLTHPTNPIQSYQLRSIQKQLIAGSIIDLVL